MLDIVYYLAHFKLYLEWSLYYNNMYVLFMRQVLINVYDIHILCTYNIEQGKKIIIE